MPKSLKFALMYRELTMSYQIVITCFRLLKAKMVGMPCVLGFWWIENFPIGFQGILSKDNTLHSSSLSENKCVT